MLRTCSPKNIHLPGAPTNDPKVWCNGGITALYKVQINATIAIIMVVESWITFLDLRQAKPQTTGLVSHTYCSTKTYASNSNNSNNNGISSALLLPIQVSVPPEQHSNGNLYQWSKAKIGERKALANLWFRTRRNKWARKRCWARLRFLYFNRSVIWTSGNSRMMVNSFLGRRV